MFEISIMSIQFEEKTTTTLFKKVSVSRLVTVYSPSYTCTPSSSTPMKISKSISAPVLKSEPEPIKVISSMSEISSFEACPSEAPGYQQKIEKSVKQSLETKLNRKIEALSLTRPSLRGKYCMVGSDNPHGEERKHHHLMCMNWSNIGSSDYFLSQLEIDEPVQDIHWAADDFIIAATGEKSLRIIHKDENHKLTQRAQFKDIHHDVVREIALNKGKIGQFVSGGLDNRLCLTDLNTMERLMQSVELNDFIGSVKWPIEYNQNIGVSCTLDSGMYLVFDIRQTLRKPCFQANMGKQDLMTHERYSDYHSLMGFADGEIHHVDMRVHNKTLHQIQDPFVEGIHSICYNHKASGFVVSGFTDFSAWKQNTSSQRAQIWFHSQLEGRSVHNATGFSMHAIFSEKGDQVITTTNAGSLGVYNP